MHQHFVCTVMNECPRCFRTDVFQNTDDIFSPLKSSRRSLTYFPSLSYYTFMHSCTLEPPQFCHHIQLDVIHIFKIGHLDDSFEVEKGKKTCIAILGEQGSCSSTVMFFLARKCWMLRAYCEQKGGTVMAKHPRVIQQLSPLRANCQSIFLSKHVFVVCTG